MVEEQELAVSIGQRIKKARLKAGLNQSDVAKHLGITQAGWSKIENGGTLISLDHLLKLRPLFNVPLTWFLPDEVLTNEDKKNALGDPRVLEIFMIFEQSSEAARNHILEAARLAARLQGLEILGR